MEQPLTGIRVLDLGQIYNGPYCGHLLGWLGADVIKVEPPGGENSRSRDETGEPPSIQFLNSNKQGIVLNLKKDDGKQTFKELVKHSDVLVENFSPGTMEELGLGYETLKKENPGLIYGHSSGYGSSGPYKDYPAMDITIQAMSGVMHITGFEDRPPVKAGPAVCDILGGAHLTIGIVSALYQRELTGHGQYVDVGMLDAMYPALSSSVAGLVREDDVPPRIGNRHPALERAPYNVYATTDGYIAIACVNNPQWFRLVDLMDSDEVREDERFATPAKRAENNEAVDTVVSEWAQQQSRDHAVERLRENDIPSAPVRTLSEVIDDPHLKARGMIHDTPNASGKGREHVPVPGLPMAFSESDSPEFSRSPRLGEHTREVLADVAGYSDSQIEALEKDDVIFSRPHPDE